MFSDKDFIENTTNIILNQRDYMSNQLKTLKELKVYNTQGNFILCEIISKDLTANQLREKLIPKKIIIRDCSSFEGLDEYFFRVCILKPEQNQLLINELNTIFKNL